PITNRTSSKNSKINQKVNTVSATHINTARPKVNTIRPKAVLNAVQGNHVNVVKASACWVWNLKHKVLDHVSRNNGASMSFKRFDYVDAQGRSKPITNRTSSKNSKINQKVNTVSATHINTARPKVNTVRPKAVLNAVQGNHVNVVKASACWVWNPKHKVLDHVSRNNGASMSFKRFDYGNTQQDLKDKGVINSGCSRHMTGNKSYLTDYKEINGGFVAFGGNSKGRKITGKGKIKTGKLDFKDVYFVKKLKFNLFSVSQMCDKKNIALFTDTACVVLSSDFKLTGESHVLLKVHRKDNMYSVELKNVVLQ
nr:ribonuclease H-like domain-containing protein [Tanacetum cinerariifolium]